MKMAMENIYLLSLLFHPLLPTAGFVVIATVIDQKIRGPHRTHLDLGIVADAII